MTLHLNEAEVRAILTMPMAIEAVEEISRKQSAGEVVIHPRRRFQLPNGGSFQYMAAADLSAGYLAMKQYLYVPGKIQFLVLLYDTTSGALVAQMEADYLGQIRTGAASGVATKYLAREDAKTAGIVGTGGQARTQLEAIAAVRKLKSVRAYGRDAARREAFCKEMSARLGISVTPADSAAQAVQEADIVCTATTATEPVLNGPELSEGVHINAMGSNQAHKRELNDSAVARANVIAVDFIEQARMEAGDLLLAFQGDESRWAKIKTLADIVTGKTQGRTGAKQITLFKSIGLASWDLAVAKKIYALAREKRMGREIRLWNTSPAN